MAFLFTITIQRSFEFNFWLIELEDDGVAAGLVARLMRRPADAHCAHVLAQPDGERTEADAVGDELRPGEKVEERMPEGVGRGRGERIRVIAAHRLGELPAQKILCVESEPRHDHGVEALNADVAVVVGYDLIGLFAQLAVALAVLELTYYRAAAAHNVQHLREEGDGLVGAAETQLAQLAERKLVHARVHAAYAVERIIVEHDDLPVLGKLHIQLDAVARLGGETECLQRVLRHALVAAVQTAVGAVRAHKGRSLPLRGRAGGDKEERGTACRRAYDRAAERGVRCTFKVISHFVTSVYVGTIQLTSYLIRLFYHRIGGAVNLPQKII